MRYALLLALIALPAYATKTIAPPEEPPVQEVSAEAIAAAQAAAKAAAIAALEANPTATASSDPTLVNESPSQAAITSRTTAIGLSMGALNPIQPISQCYKPSRGYKRAHRMFFGAWEVSAVAELDPLCVAMLEKQNTHDLEMAKIQLELERERNSRIRLETEFIESQQKGARAR